MTSPVFSAHKLACQPRDLAASLVLKLAFLALISGVNVALAAPPPDPATLPAAISRSVDFIKDIQPIFQRTCLNCHGPDKAKGDFVLDSREHALKGGEMGPVIIPGDSAKSPLVHFTARVVEDSEMPPVGKGDPLTAEQVGLLRGWIDQGAIWPDGLVLSPERAEAAAPTQNKRDHWAFKPPIRPAVPLTKNSKWARNPIDHFVLARLESEKLKPSPEADRTTLLRRLSLDLTGLPPALSELRAFLADTRTNAYELQVERLLASAHYGERWGRHWLDVAAYADTNGYEKDKPRSIWPFRDWVIKALNRDEPFDRFVEEQLAGDLLPAASLDQRVATGFLRNAMLNQEGGIEPEQFRVEALIDRVDTLGKSLMGLTFNCCQCHDHKYDPFSQKEYYQLYAFLNNDDESFIEVPTAKDLKKRAELLGQVAKLEDEAWEGTTNRVERVEEWAKRFRSAPTNWVPLDPSGWFSFASKFEKQSDLSLLGGGDLQAGGILRIEVETQMTNITGFRLEALTNANLMLEGPGLEGNGVFLLKEFVVTATPLTNSTVTNVVKFRRASADQQAQDFAITNAIDGNTEKGGWTPTFTAERRNQNHTAVFECDEPIGFPGGTRLLFTLHQSKEKESKLEAHLLGCLRLSATTEAAPLEADPLSPVERKILDIASAERTPEQNRQLFTTFRLNDPSFGDLNKKIDNVWTNWPAPPTTLVLHQREQPRVTHIFKRGDRLRPGEVVQPNVASVLPPLPPEAPPNRLGLARWLVDPRHPTVARVAVNRVWQAYFGQGLVTTPEDFGSRVEAPSHRELLDWLACEFVEPTWKAEPAGAVPWSLKQLHRLIVCSAVYRQSSHVPSDLLKRDPLNRSLARGPRFRVEAEIVHDMALSIGGLLNKKIGGPSIYPPIPANVGDTSYGGFTWPESKGEDLHRRAMYTFAKRSLPFPSLATFDSPSGEISCPRRARSDTPLQALTTLNERMFVEAAQGLAMRLIKEGGQSDADRLAYGFQLCTGRKPNAAQKRRLLQFWREQVRIFDGDTAAAVAVSSPDPKKLVPGVNLHRAAAWAMVSRVLLNMDETFSRE